MRCAIMQPTYLPWSGYFDLIRSVDRFIFLDDVQFEKGSWQQRNRIVINGQESYLTIPVHKSGKSAQKLLDVRTVETRPWRRDHRITVGQAYARTPFGDDVVQLLSDCLDHVSDALVDVNIRLILVLCQRLGIETTVIRSSEIPVDGKRSEYVLKLCKYVGADEYLSPVGAKEYIEEEGLFATSPVDVKYQQFLPKHYPQKGKASFVPYMSVIDLIANVGYESALDYIVNCSR